MIELALLRHGHTPWNRAGRIQGRTDVALDAEARATLGGLRLPEGWEAARLWSSPLSRAVETALLVAGRAPEVSPALFEMDWGDWEGARREDLFADPAADYRHLEDWGWDYRPPGGESAAEMRARLRPWVEGLAGRNLAVCHIGVMRVLLALAWGWDFDGPAPFQVKRNRLYLIRIEGGHWQAEAAPIKLEARLPCG